MCYQGLLKTAEFKLLTFVRLITMPWMCNVGWKLHTFETSTLFTCAISFHPGRESSVCISYECRWTPRPVWTVTKGKILLLPRIEHKSFGSQPVITTICHYIHRLAYTAESATWIGAGTRTYIQTFVWCHTLRRVTEKRWQDNERADVPNEKTHNNELTSRNLFNGFPVYVTMQFHI